jgi:hypothetical protein
MGIAMWFRMKLNPAPPDPTQKMIFDWMPLIRLRQGYGRLRSARPPKLSA